ncbi:MAG: hypothetical protein AAFV53_11400 [Myxococcota bacterium]
MNSALLLGLEVELTNSPHRFVIVNLGVPHHHDGCVEQPLVVLDQSGVLKCWNNTRGIRLTEQSRQKLWRRLDHNPFGKPPSWGYVSLMGRQTIVGLITEYPGGEVEVCEIGTNRHVRIPRQARHAMETGLTQIEADRLFDACERRGYLELNDAREILAGDRDLPPALVGQQVELLELRERWLISEVSDEKIALMSMDGVVRLELHPIEYIGKVWRVHQNFPQPQAGIRFRWETGGKDGVIEGTIAGEADKEFEQTSYRTGSINLETKVHTKRVLVLDSGQTLHSGDWGCGNLKGWTILSMPEGWPTALSILPELPTIKLKKDEAKNTAYGSSPYTNGGSDDTPF